MERSDDRKDFLDDEAARRDKWEHPTSVFIAQSDREAEEPKLR